jgi:hypothetical protein
MRFCQIETDRGANAGPNSAHSASGDLPVGWFRASKIGAFAIAAAQNSLREKINFLSQINVICPVQPFAKNISVLQN